MGNIRFANNASAQLAAGITNTDTSITVGAGEGALFPTVGAPLYAKVTLEDTLGNYEIVHLTARSGDVLTIVRAQEGTIAIAFASGSRVESRPTAAALNEYLQKSGDTFTGELVGTGGGQITGARINAGELVGVPMRGETGNTTNQLVVPAAGAPPTIGGSMIYTVANLTQSALNAIAFPVGTVLMFNGLIGNIPAGFQICDGTNGTLDLRDMFVIGAGSTYAVGASGGLASTTSGPGGTHTPTIQGTVLTEAQLPSHTHFIATDLEYSGGGNQDLSASNRAYRSTNGGPGGDTQYILRGTVAAAATIGLTSAAGSGSTHTHVADAVPDHTHSVATLPPYRALFFIQRV
jgi:hypothetical protein